ncbi:hypothetical protein [Hymenobacter guriensis]|uniref:Uncharacterized protein n=1 Tax=Hymenobacter guriensis TaxID=2793065 RepID=A0ABS0KZ59_9BACT|nr:hypothetical protein [Hymenobacter guriensis]MBG8553126.1 hypothetical protein [Hymenobacter guriensis]
MLPFTALTALYLVPAGHRLDFPTPPGYYADVYRQLGAQTWECIAHHACSPFLDRTALGSNPSYYVQYRDKLGALAGRTALVRTAPEALPSNPCWLRLS